MTELNVSNIQHFSIGDGPGIRTTVFLKGCNLRCPWCHNPETISGDAEELFFEKTGKRVLYGKKMSVDDVISDVMEDVDFYRASGGGITVSGGEPLLQSEAVYELLSEIKKKGVSTLVDTAGNVPWSAFERVMGVTDLFYYDFKTASEEKYYGVIGARLDRISENLHRLISAGAGVQVRIPLIPDFNTSAADTEKIISHLLPLGVRSVDLLPFHRLGSAKYSALGKEYAYKDVAPYTLSEVEKIKQTYEKHFKVSIEK